MSEPPESQEELDRLRAERDALRAQLDAQGEKRPRRSRLRRALAVLLVVLASITVPLATTAVWARRTLINTAEFSDTVAPLARERAVQIALTDYLTVQIMGAIDIEELFAEALPERGQLLVGPLTNATAELWHKALGRGHYRMLLWRLHPNRLDRALKPLGYLGIPVYVTLVTLRDMGRQFRGLRERGLTGAGLLKLPWYLMQTAAFHAAGGVGMFRALRKLQQTKTLPEPEVFYGPVTMPDLRGFSEPEGVQVEARSAADAMAPEPEQGVKVEARSAADAVAPVSSGSFAASGKLVVPN